MISLDDEQAKPSAFVERSVFTFDRETLQSLCPLHNTNQWDVSGIAAFALLA